MGDRRRFDVFARFIANQVPKPIRGDVRVADVAAGKGALSFALREHGFTHITPFEPSPRKGGQVRRLGIRAQLFTPEIARDFDLVVGMHPDEATDCILDGAAKAGIMAIVCPCCAKPTSWTYWGQKAPGQWVRHLVAKSASLGLPLSKTSLPISGASTVLWGGKL
jgi:hypothetical protein